MFTAMPVDTEISQTSRGIAQLHIPSTSLKALPRPLIPGSSLANRQLEIKAYGYIVIII